MWSITRRKLFAGAAAVAPVAASQAEPQVNLWFRGREGRQTRDCVMTQMGGADILKTRFDPNGGAAIVLRMDLVSNFHEHLNLVNLTNGSSHQFCDEDFERFKTHWAEFWAVKE